MFYVYKITCKVNGKAYIGITTKTVEYRWRQHAWTAYDENCKEYNDIFKKAIRKYGIDNFLVETIAESDSLDELKELEKKYIQEYNTFAFNENSNGYNSTLGGDGVFGRNHRGLEMYQVYPFQLVEKFDSLTEAEKKYGKAIRLKALQAEFCSYNHLLCVCSDLIDGLSDEEAMQFIYRKNNVLVQCDMNNKLVRYWFNAEEASQTNGFSKQNITACIHGRRISHGGYRWYYYRDYEVFKENGFPEKRYTTKSKEIIQYDLDLNEIARFNSSYEMEMESGFKANAVVKCCLGITSTALGYVWRFGTNPITDIEKRLIQKNVERELKQIALTSDKSRVECEKKSIKKIVNKRQAAIVQYDECGNILNVFTSVREACKVLHLTHRLLTAACKKELETYRGFIWRFAYEPLSTADIECIKSRLGIA